MTNKNVRFFSHFLGGFRKSLYRKVVFSYSLSYLTDKKEYRKEKIFVERIAGSKSSCIFVQ